MNRFSKSQKFEISRLLGERYASLQLRLKCLKPLYDRHQTMYQDFVDEMDLIDSILKVL